MRRQLTTAVLLCIAPVICFGQQSSHKLCDYVGTWQASFHGTAFITINLVEKNGHLTGSAGIGDIYGDPNGVITSVEAPASESPIISTRLLQSGDLELTSRGDDPDDKITVVLELTGAKSGSVRFGIAMGHDATLVKPIAVQKIESKL